MATNTVRRTTSGSVTYRLTVASTVESSDPVLFSDMTTTAITDYNEPYEDGKATVEIHGVNEIREYTVEAVNNSGNSAVAIGDTLYYDSAATIKINKDATNGKQFGYALETITSGGSDSINVALING